MKKFLLIATFLMTGFVTIKAQNDSILTITQIWNIPGHQVRVCANKYNRVLVYPPTGCTDFLWEVNGEVVYYDYVTFDKDLSYYHAAYFYGCGYDGMFDIIFQDPNVPTETTEEIWIHSGELAELRAVEGDSASMYNIHWSSGENQNVIYKPAGTYIVAISDMCATSYRTKIVKENVEVYRATVDLETNLNKTTWQVTEAQAEYINEVKVYRDGLFVGTVPYEEGYYLDAIGSDNAARNYHLVGITTEGEDCPIESYEKGTIHTTYYQDVNSNLNMTWNIPYVEQGAQGTLTYFQICKYDPVTEQLTVVDQVNSLITDYTCGVNQFAGGYPVIAAVFSDAKNRDFEDLSFSNMYTDIAVQPQEITISLAPGWNWISYPYAVAMDIAAALGDFVPMEGDIIKSQTGVSSYHNGQWMGSFQQFIPGFGYVYFSTRAVPVTLVFGLSSSHR